MLCSHSVELDMIQPLNNHTKKIMVALVVESAFHLQRRLPNINSTTSKVSQPISNTTSLDKITELCKQGHLKEALQILYVKDSFTDSSAYVSLLRACIQKKTLPEGKLIHAHMNERGFMADRILQNTLLNMYVKCGSLVDARRVFNQMPQRDVCSWTVMIAGYARHGPAEEALRVFNQMEPTGVEPNSFTFSCVVSACANLASLEQGVKIHEEIIRKGFQCHLSVTNALVDMYAKCGEMEKARELFDKMHQPNVVSWTTLISGYAHNKRIDEALKVFKEMPARDVYSWNAMIAGFSRNGFIDEAAKLFEEMPRRDMFSWNVMMAGFAQNGLVDEALRVFDEMPQRTTISWNAMIAGFAQNGHDGEALKLFHKMQLAGVKPDSKTFASVLPACANLTSLEKGMEIHDEINKRGFQSDAFVMSALVDMYGKCGSIQKARALFDSMHQRDVVSWTSMITGYAMHGYAKEALQLFEEMKWCGINPNYVTLLSVLSACSHAGLVDEGHRYFNSMTAHYHITPSMEHYRCMVDLLCRAGHLDEAQNFINNMPIQPDAAVWSCLLSACRMHNNVELGEWVAECIFELDPTSAAPYVLLSNIYAAAGRWGDIEKVRRMMKNRGIKKTPGCSWIEVNNQVHAFLGGDESHPQTQEIYKELESFSQDMKMAGYLLDTKFLLNDVEEKEHIL